MLERHQVYVGLINALSTGLEKGNKTIVEGISEYFEKTAFQENDQESFSNISWYFNHFLIIKHDIPYKGQLELIDREKYPNVYKCVKEKIRIHINYLKAKETITFESERLFFKPMNRCDKSIIYDLIENDKEGMDSFNLRPVSHMKMLDDLLNEKYGVYMIFKKQSNEPIGFIAVGGWSNNGETWQIGYYIFKEFRNHGYCQESIRCIYDRVRKEKISLYRFFAETPEKCPRPKRLVAFIRDSNNDSRNVLVKSGFKRYYGLGDEVEQWICVYSKFLTDFKKS